jgi:hypothetical protein
MIHEHSFKRMPSPRQNLPFGYFSVIKDSKAQVLSFWVLLDRPLPLRPGIQALQSAGLITIPTLYQRLGDRGCQQKGGGRGGGGGVLKSKKR